MIILIFSSCSPAISETVEVRIAQEHPFEAMLRHDLWYTLAYFDGETVRTMHVPEGRRSLQVPVLKGGLRVFAMVPEGDLGPIGGFYEGDGPVLLRGEDGSFADMLIRASEYRKDAVSRLSVRNLRKTHPDLSAINETEFLEDLFDGTLTPSAVITAETQSYEFEAIPRGEWISERYDIPSFEVPFTARPVSLSLRPGVFRFANAEKGLLLTIAVDEQGASYASVTALPLD